MDEQQAPQLDRWLRQGFLRRTQTSLITASQTGNPASLPRVAPGPEALGYVGVFFLLAALITWIGKAWVDWESAVRVALLLVVSAAFVALGMFARRMGGLTGSRFCSFCAAVAVGFFTVAMLIMTMEQLDMDDPKSAVTIAGILGTAFAIGIYIWHRTGGAVFAVFVVSIVTMIARMGIGLSESAMSSYQSPMHGMAVIGYWITAFGVLFVLLAWLKVLQPPVAGMSLGFFAAMIGPLLVIAESRSTAALLGLTVTAAAFIAGHVRLMPEIARGAAIGAWIYGAVAVEEYLSDLGDIGSLAIGGIIMLIAAGVFARVTAQSMPGPMNAETSVTEETTWTSDAIVMPVAPPEAPAEADSAGDEPPTS